MRGRRMWGFLRQQAAPVAECGAGQGPTLVGPLGLHLAKAWSFPFTAVWRPPGRGWRAAGARQEKEVGVLQPRIDP